MQRYNIFLRYAIRSLADTYVAGRDTEWRQLWTALYQVWWVYASEHGEEVLPEDMEKYAFREVLSY